MSGPLIRATACLPGNVRGSASIGLAHSERGTMKTVIASAAVLALAPLAFVAPSAEAAPHAFANCTAMHRKFHHGVARSNRAANYQVRQGYGRPKVSLRWYRLNSRSPHDLDRDNDGTACEA